MPTFILTGRYSLDAVRGLMAKPEDRTEAVSAVVSAAGGTFLHYWVTTGATDFVLVAEADRAEEFLAGVMTAAGYASPRAERARERSERARERSERERAERARERSETEANARARE